MTPELGAVAPAYYKKDFWSRENPKYTTPHFRLEKAARLANELAGASPCTLLDVGCGPATLRNFLRPNIRYFGIDIAIQEPAPELLEIDILESPIRFGDKHFDIVVAQGLFEYLGSHQEETFSQIADLLTASGVFIVSYVNFGHRSRQVYWPYSNVQPLHEFRRSLARHFVVRRMLPTAHNWNHSEPNKPWLRRMNMSWNRGVPYLSQKLAVEYFFVCSGHGTSRA